MLVGLAILVSYLQHDSLDLGNSHHRCAFLSLTWSYLAGNQTTLLNLRVN